MDKHGAVDTRTYLQHIIYNKQLQMCSFTPRNSYNHYDVHKDSHLNQPSSGDSGFYNRV